MPNITTVYNSGLDALSNLFEVNINLNDAVQDFFDPSIREEIVFRIQNAPIPQSQTQTYSIDWGVWTFDRPNGKINPNRTISFNIRVDRAFAVYQGFVNWKNAIQNEYTGIVSDVKNYTTDITIYPITTLVGESQDYVLSTVGEGIKLENAWIQDVGDLSFSQGSGDPLEMSVTFNFLRMNKDFFEPSGSAEEQGGSDESDIV